MNKQVTYRKDYQPPLYTISKVVLTVTLGEEKTRVKNTMQINKNPQSEHDGHLFLNGQKQQLISLKLDDTALTADQYQLTDEGLTIFNIPPNCQIEVISECQPQNNTSLMGLYKSSGNFCTQCESEGFRNITFYIDRPDVMALFTVHIIADKEKYPVLLSNGNLIDSGEQQDGKHFAVWQDPFHKPCYLFALVAGNLAHIEDRFTTMSGREVTLHIFAQAHNIDKCHHAMSALKKAMKWDEEAYGREYDLDIFMIVAVDDFNFGAMENKGLNIFNSRYILVDAKTSTDTDYSLVDAVVAHEYFHNWSGNRVTLRDWFQITLKEGLTVFRDHCFSQSISSSAVTRIDQVKTLREVQFAEDSGPLAHPIRPDSYIEMSNFYTATVYEKGSEIIRMQKTILGEEAYRRGTDLYFSRHDGQAVTCEDFTQAMEEVGSIDLSQFRLWYQQAGTPELTVRSRYDSDEKIFNIHVSQHCPPSPGQPEKKPFYIPLKLALLDKEGNDMPLQLEERPERLNDDVLIISQSEESFTFINVKEKPLPSFLRGFSAPVKLNYDYSEQQLAFMMTHDHDEFCRWRSFQDYAVNEMKRLIDEQQQGSIMHPGNIFISSIQSLLDHQHPDPAFLAEMLSLPTEAYMVELLGRVDIDLLCQARSFLLKNIGHELENYFVDIYQQNNQQQVYEYTVDQLGKRRLKNIALKYLMETDSAKYAELALKQFKQADNMTDQLAGFAELVRRETVYRQQAIEEFYRQWQQQKLVIDKWFAIQAMADIPDYYHQLRVLLDHQDFNLKNPNRLRAVLGSMSRNLKQFHHISGQGYQLIADYGIRLDAINPMTAARLIGSLTVSSHYDDKRQSLMKAQLMRISQQQNLSKDSYEIVSKSLS